MRISSLLNPELISVAAVSMMLCGCTPGVRQQKSAEPLSYSDVERNPKAAIGQKVVWAGHEMEYRVSSDAQGKTETSTTYLLQSPPPPGSDLKFFVVHEETSQKTEAAKRLGERDNRKISGTISKMVTRTVSMSGVRQELEVPFISNATVDAADNAAKK